MKEILGNIWVFTATYAAVIALFTYATFIYDLVFVPGRQATFLVIYAVASIVFLLLMLYSREIFVTRLISLLMLPIVFLLLLFNIGNSNWTLIIPPFIVALVVFFAAGTKETVKVIFGTIYLLMYVLGIVAYIVCNMLFRGSVQETVLDMKMDPTTAVYSYYKTDLVHLSEVVADENAYSPVTGEFRFYLTDVKDSADGCVKIYVVPANKDIKLKFFSLNVKGIKKVITTKGTRGVVPDVGWTIKPDSAGTDTLYVCYKLGPNDNWKEMKVTQKSMPDRNPLEFLGISA